MDFADALHLAFADEADEGLATFDKRLATAARRAGGRKVLTL
jgi:predicted nucleic acid-binding protein